MAVLRLSMREYVRYHDRLAKEFKPAAVRGIRSGAAQAIGYLVERTRKVAPASDNGPGGGAVDRGGFVARWKAIDASGGSVIRNSSPYAAVVEYGRRPGRKPPPAAVIARWLVRRVHKSKKEAKAMAFLVARAIGRRGLRGRHILTAPEARRAILRMIKKEVIRELELQLRKK